VRLPYLTIGSRTNLLFFFVHQEHLIALHLPVVTIIDTRDDLGTVGDRNAKQLKFALQDFGFMVALVVTKCVLQYSLALSNLLQRPSIAWF
jgi:hypothetical protein